MEHVIQLQKGLRVRNETDFRDPFGIWTLHIDDQMIWAKSHQTGETEIVGEVQFVKHGWKYTFGSRLLHVREVIKF